MSAENPLSGLALLAPRLTPPPQHPWFTKHPPLLPVCLTDTATASPGPGSHLSCMKMHPSRTQYPICVAHCSAPLTRGVVLSPSSSHRHIGSAVPAPIPDPFRERVIEVSCPSERCPKRRSSFLEPIELAFVSGGA